MTSGKRVIEGMDERALLLLGLLIAQSQHGYQINEFIERNLSRVTDMKKATAYTILDRLAEAAFVTMHSAQEGNRPPRKVYAITPPGEREFLRLLRENLARADRMTFASDIGMMFLDHLPLQESSDLLEERLRRTEQQLEVYTATGQHGFGLGVDLALEHHVVHLQTDLDWLRGVIHRLASRQTD